ncbi:Lung seven transmembrane receptor [Fasciolopsis buskii]|uniref:Lung seven transmembrane receptor n=1 Tax=Fasciolopsis buskii TaxID=27845 RepID=A0A8E0S7B9_9TREM|nr:Lung seven transmembrane receptor [Fasciolopsis buski]
MYSFYLHNCAVPDTETGKPLGLNLTLRMVEKNPDSFLSAGEQPLPLLYFILCCAYFLTSIGWFLYLRTSKNSVYRIHYLMFAVILIKAISLIFHGVNFYAIGRHGMHEEAWAVMYYITHIIRGALLFITILLIGAGWAFIKHMLTPRERNVFFIVIPLQILANVATIVIEESEAGTARYAVWKDIFIFVDLACCGAILFPVVWSIRHLQAASQTDGKAAINLRNLRLFRHFYILVICYVYFTRVVAYLLTITVPYTLTWVVELFKESITLFFFVAVGYKFRPVDDNPYLLVPNEDDDEDTLLERIQLEDVWSQSGYTDGVTRLSRPQSKGNPAVAAVTSGTAVGGKRNPNFLGRVVPNASGSGGPDSPSDAEV